MLRRDVIRKIVERDCQKKELEEDMVIMDAKSLHEAACKHFGTWDTALRYAGLGARHLRGVQYSHSREQVVGKLRKLCISGYSLLAKHNMHRDYKLYRAAMHYFGSWKDALEAAGVDCRNIKLHAKPRRHDKQEIIEKLRERQNAGLSIIWSEVCLENRTFAISAKQAFGSWGKVLAAAGIVAKGQQVIHKRKWDTQIVIARIQERHRQNETLVRSVVFREDPNLIHAARRYFGDWNAAMEAAGFASQECNQAKKKK